MLIEKTAQNGKEILVYSTAKPEEVDEVAEFAEDNYFNLTPIRQLFSLDDVTDEKTRLALRREGFQRCFQHPTSFLVREKSTGQLVGFMASTVRERSEESAEKLLDPDDRSFGWLVRALLAELYKGVDLYDLYKTDRILHIWRSAVRKDYLGQRLISMNDATCLAFIAKIAQENQIGALRGEGFSHFVGREKCWQLIRSIHYETFQLADGRRPFAGVDFGIHRTLRLVACLPPQTLQSDVSVVNVPKSKM